MNNDNGKALKMTLWLCIGIFTVTAVFLTGKIISAIKTPVSPDVNPQVISEPDTQKQPVQTEKAARAQASRPAPAAGHVFDYQEMRKMEQAHETQIEKMREYAEKNPNAEDALSPEQIERIQKENLLVH